MDPVTRERWVASTLQSHDLYISLDEAGNYDFSAHGTRYLIYTAVTTGDISSGVMDLYRLKHSVISEGIELEYFHAAEDRQAVRDRVFAIIGKQLTIRIDTILIDKSKTGPSLRPIEKIYPRMFQILLRYVLERPKYAAKRIYVFFDTPGVKKAKRAVEKGIKEAMVQALGPLLEERNVQYYALMHDSKSHPYLQVEDYCGWAIYRKWQNNDARSYELIRHFIWSEFDVFRYGGYRWY